MKTPTAWDLQIIADLEKSIRRMQEIVGDHASGDIVRDTIGDSKVETAGKMKDRIAAKIEGVRYIQRQFPEYFGL
jgi:hypothetical protein